MARSRSLSRAVACRSFVASRPRSPPTPGRRRRFERSVEESEGVRRRLRHTALVGQAVATSSAATARAWRADHRRSRYGDAWVFTDRNDLAQDNAEHLYRFVNEHHPEINAWFVVDRDTTDWPRLEREGFRLVQYGTAEHVLLMLNCVELISSQIDDYIVNPLNVGRFGKRRWRFTFLQHGVTKDDLSRRLNRQRIDRLITATEAEHQSIAGDGTPYVFTDKEVRLTGFPRHDRLLRLAEAPDVLAADRLLLLMPTWRRQLVGDAMRPGGDRAAHPGFFESPYATNWLELLRSERLSELAERAGLSIAFVPHPNSTEFLTGTASRPRRGAPVPGRRHPGALCPWCGDDHRLLVERFRARLPEPAGHLLPVRSGGLLLRPARLPPRRMELRDATASVPSPSCRPRFSTSWRCSIDREMKPGEPYAGRMAQAFAFRDGKCCARVLESIRSMRRPPDLGIARSGGQTDGP